MKGAPFNTKEQILDILDKYALAIQNENIDHLSALEAQLSDILSKTKKLNLTGENIDAVRAQCISKALQTNKTLTDLDLSSNPIGDGLQALASALKQNKALMRLILIRADLNIQGIVALSEALIQNSGLCELDLSNNEINDEGALWLSRALTNNPTLYRLNLNFNDIGDHGAKALADMVVKNPVLFSLTLRSNDITYMGAQYLIDAIPNSISLTKLDINCKGITKWQITQIATAIKERDAPLVISKKAVGGLLLASVGATTLEQFPLYWVETGLYNFIKSSTQMRFWDYFKQPANRKEMFQFDGRHYFEKVKMRAFRYPIWHTLVDYIQYKHGRTIKQKYPEYGNVIVQSAAGATVGLIEPMFRPAMYLGLGFHFGFGLSLLSLLLLNVPGSIALFGGSALVNKKLKNENKASMGKDLLANCIGGMAAMAVSHPMENFWYRCDPDLRSSWESFMEMTPADFRKGFWARTLIKGSKVGFGLTAFGQMTKIYERKFGHVIPKKELPFEPSSNVNNDQSKRDTNSSIVFSARKKYPALTYNPFSDSMQFSLEEELSDKLKSVRL